MNTNLHGDGPYIQRDIESIFSKENGLITALVGPRRSGKSTLLVHFKERLDLAGHPSTMMLWIDGDRLVDRERLGSRPESLERWIEETMGRPISTLSTVPFFLFVDEAQKISFLFEAVKILYDSQKNKVRIFISGSASLEIFQKTAETLAGRIRYLRLHPFSLRERARAKNVALPDVAPLALLLCGKANPTEYRTHVLPLYSLQNALVQEVADMLVWGGFPQVVMCADVEERRIYLQNYKETYLEKDIRPMDWVGDLHAFSNLMRFLAESEGSIVQYKQLTQTLGISFQTLKKYLSVLEATFLQYFLYPYILHAKRRLQKSPKTYFSDLGLVSLLSTLYDLSLLEKTGSIGHRFESWVMGEMRKHLCHFQKEGEFYFWRTSGGVEVDCVFRGPAGVLIPIEIKYGATLPDSSRKSLRAFLEDYSPSAPYGVVVYNGPFEYLQHERIFCVPAWQLM